MVRAQRGSVTTAPFHPTIEPELALKRLQKLLEQVPEIRSSGRLSAAFQNWRGDIKIVLSSLNGENSTVFKEFEAIRFNPGIFYPSQPDAEFVSAFNLGMERATGFLESRINNLRDIVEPESPTNNGSLPASPDGRRVFVVHGSDDGTKEMVARFLGQLQLEPVILHEQPNMGRTLIEKFESHASDVQCAVVILTADDIASRKDHPEQTEARARQNVILELGYFVGKLGRERTLALVEKGVDLPSDIHGLVYIQLDNGEWRLRLVKELKAARIEVDANNAF